MEESNKTSCGCVNFPFKLLLAHNCILAIAGLGFIVYYLSKSIGFSVMISKVPRNKQRIGTLKNFSMKNLKLNTSVKPDTSIPVPEKSKVWEIDFKEITLKELVGYGTSSTVHRAEWCGTTVAVKKLNENLLEGRHFDQFSREIELMSSIHHPNVVLFLGATFQQPNVCIVLEFLECGSIYDFIRQPKNEQFLSMFLIVKFALDIARGMKYLHHQLGIIQRDLKSQNVLLDNSLNCKICDFGLSRHTASDRKMTHCGTPYWTAPEVIMLLPYNEKADVYSFAILLWELLSREEPYAGENGLGVSIKVAKEGLRPKMPPFCPEEYGELMKDCWQSNPDLRPDFSIILERLHAISKLYKSYNMSNNYAVIGKRYSSSIQPQ